MQAYWSKYGIDLSSAAGVAGFKAILTCNVEAFREPDDIGWYMQGNKLPNQPTFTYLVRSYLTSS